MVDRTDLFQPFRTINKDSHQYALEWKARTGGKVIGWICTYCPSEIIYAAGILPVRILGSHQVDRITERYAYGYLCPFSHDCLAQGLRGRYDYLDGVIHARSCEMVAQVYHNWHTHIMPNGFHFFVYHPGTFGDKARTLLGKEYVDFKNALEKFFGVTVTDSALHDAIAAYNENRHLLRQLFELRKQDPPLLTGEEALHVVRASQVTDVKEHSRLLKQLLEALPSRTVRRDPGARLLLIGSENDDTELVASMEQLGLTFVFDESCTGARYFWDDVISNGNPIQSLATRYVDRWPCAFLDWPGRKRLERILRAAKDYSAQGAIIYRQKFCQPHSYDIPYLSKELQKNGIPTYMLEFDIVNPVGQFRTRIEAFLETLMMDIL